MNAILLQKTFGNLSGFVLVDGSIGVKLGLVDPSSSQGFPVGG